MTLKFSFLKKTQQFVVVGPVDEMKLGWVQVQKKDGTLKTENIIKLSTPFPDHDTGVMSCFGFITPIPWKAPSK